MNITPESNIPNGLLEAYLKTDYSFKADSKTIVIRLDEENPDLLSYLKLRNITSWAFLTAWNPFSFPQTDEYNHSQQQHYKAFEELTGEPLALGKEIFIKKFSHGGISSRFICADFWLDKTFPIMVKGIKKILTF